MNNLRENINSLIKYKQTIKKRLFISNNNSFNKNTPNYILKDIDCQKVAIKNNINSIHFLKTIDNSIIDYVIMEAKRQNYILRDNSPIVLKRNIEIVKNSILLDVSSCNYVDWNYLEAHFSSELDMISKIIIDKGYVLSSFTPKGYLTNNIDIILSSIKKDINSFQFANLYLASDNYDIFKTLILNNYSFDVSFIMNHNLSCYKEYEVLEKTLKKIDFFSSDNEEFIKNYTKFYHDIINNKPLIKNFDEILSYLANKEWNKHYHENINYYANIQLKICTIIQSFRDFDVVQTKLPFLKWMKDVLGDNYNLLLDNMREYFNIYYSNEENKSAKLLKSRDVIARLSSLYVSNSKEQKKREIIDKGYDYLKDYYEIKKDNPYICKRIILERKKRKFLETYNKNDKNFQSFINELFAKYNEIFSFHEINMLIDDYLFQNIFKLEKIIPPPNGYKEYERMKKSLKIFHRLQKGYITYDSNEAINYHDLITYDNGIYTFNKKEFSEEERNDFQIYSLKQRAFKDLKYDIIRKIDVIEVDETITDRDIFHSGISIPFTDKYYEFIDDNVNLISLGRFMDECMNMGKMNIDSFINNDNLNVLYNFFLDKNIMWLFLLLILNNYEIFYYYDEISSEYLIRIINEIGNINTLAKIMNKSLDKVENIFHLLEIRDKASLEDIAVLGIDNIIKLCEKDDYTSGDYDKIISMARELLLQMMRRSSSTVPYLNGEYLNYKYSMYDSQDDSILFSGIDTDACFKIGGNDHDFMHYCALDKNGFVLKICDNDNNFLARAAGFRNGNCIFINQLRTIYDVCGNNYDGINVKEKKDIIKVFEKACENIIETSWNNKNEKTKIDFVFVTKSYILSNYDNKKNVSDKIDEIIGNDPMDNESDDWEKFVNTAYNLEECESTNAFETDYGCYPTLLIARNKNKILKEDNIVFKDVPAVYKRKRNKIKIALDNNDEVYRKINRINSCDCFYNNYEFDRIIIPKGSIIIYGDNWYIIYLNGNIVASKVLDFDEMAKKEYSVILNELLSCKVKNDVKKLIKKYV